MRIHLICLILVVVGLMSCAKPVALEAGETIRTTFHLQKIGASARDLLSDEHFTALHIEVQYMPGYEPDDEALHNLQDFLYGHLNKPAGIRVTTKEIPSITDTALTIGEVAALEGKHRTTYTTGKELAVYVLYTNGYYAEDTLLGYAYRNTSAVLFGRTLDDNSNRFKKLDRSDLETRVLLHEFSHMMGLVNVGSPLQTEHKDNDHGKHCSNKDCLMYYLTDTELSPSFLLRKDTPRLDSACLADLKANGGK